MISRKTFDLLGQYWSFNSRIHGTRHWAHVAYLGRKLAHEHGLDDASLRCINAFAWTHDLWRTHDGSGNQHGRDGCMHFAELECDLVQQLSDPEMQLVARAIYYHSDGYVAGEAYDLGLFEEIDLPEQWIIDTVGCCWDADRLDLLRLGREPDEKLMSTEHWYRNVSDAIKINKRS